MKYTKIGFCECGTPFIRKRGRKRLYCDLCRHNKQLEWNRNYEKTREKRDRRDDMAKYRKLGTIQDKQKIRSSADTIGKPQKEWDDEDWKRYANKVKKMKQQTIGGYQNYKEVD